MSDVVTLREMFSAYSKSTPSKLYLEVKSRTALTNVERFAGVTAVEKWVEPVHPPTEILEIAPCSLACSTKSGMLVASVGSMVRTAGSGEVRLKMGSERSV